MSFLRKFGKEKNGSAAIEFVLVSPLLITLIFGSAGMFDQFQAKERAALAADSLSDLLGRSIVMNDYEASVIFDAAVLTLGKYADDTHMEVIMVGYVYDETNDEWEVAWSRGLKKNADSSAPPTQITSPVVGSTLADANTDFPKVADDEMLVYSKVKFVYANKLFKFKNDGITYQESAIRKPRYQAKIAWEDPA
ncbi:MAG: TadE/TadG family type IV pilus assembly protein [bacterium]